MPVLYTFVSRGLDTPLADCTLPNHEANFQEIALKILKKSNAGPSDLDGKKLTYIYEGHTFNFIGVKNLIFLCVADEAAGRILPFSFLTEISEAFAKSFKEDASSESCSVFKTVLAQKMNKYSTIGSVEPSSTSPNNANSNAATGISAGLSGVGTLTPNGTIDLRPSNSSNSAPEETGRPAKVKGVQRGLDEVKGIMAMNTEKVMSRGEALDSLMDKSDTLTHSSERFKSHSRRLRQTLCWADVKMKIMVVIGGLFLIYLLLASKCGFSLDCQ
jgi:hypothetical protein